ncbi:MAG: MFS transporter [Rhizobiaceae bacterium]
MRQPAPLRPGPMPPIWLLTIFTAAGMLGMHVFAPALPLIAADFAATPAETQYTISLYVAALAVGQLVYGPLSDRLGRRPVIIGGLALFVAACVLAMLASSLGQLILARILQGFGGCAGLVLARAIVQDVSQGSNSAGTIATLNIVQLIGSAVAPVVGLALAGHLGWRVVPAMLCALGLAGIAGAVWWLRETGARAVRGGGVGAYLAVFGAPGFVAYLTVGAFTTTTLFCLVSTMPFVVTANLARPEGDVGRCYFVLVAGVICGGYVAKRLAGRVDLDRVILAATGLGVLCGGALLAMVLSGTLALLPYLAGGFGFALTCGIMGVAALARTTEKVGALKGTAVGIYGFTQMAAGALSIVLGSVGPDVALTSTLTLAAFAAGGFLVFLAHWLRAPRRGTGI